MLVNPESKYIIFEVLTVSFLWIFVLLIHAYVMLINCMAYFYTGKFYA